MASGADDKLVDESDVDGLLWDAEQALKDHRTQLTDFEWNMLNHKWDEHTEMAATLMLKNPLWTMVVKQKKEAADDFPLPPLTPSEMKLRHLAAMKHRRRSSDSKRLAALTARKVDNPKNLKHRKLNLFKFFNDWDNASFPKRDKMIFKFIEQYRTEVKVHDSDHTFANGGSLVFCRFVVAMELCNLKSKKVWHYFDALSVLVRTMQGDRYTEEFMRLGGMNFITTIIRGQEVPVIDKLYACNFLIDMMEARNGHIIKRFVINSPHFLEMLIDSLTMCKEKSLIDNWGNMFQILCIEMRPANIPILFNFMMHAIPCDFNPMLQAMAFTVLQRLVRLDPSLATKCIKPIMDNLKGSDKELLVEMSNLCLVILHTKVGEELVKALMLAADGIKLKDSFTGDNRPKLHKSQPPRENAMEMKHIREKRDKSRAKQLKMDHFMTQGGALFVLNKIMTSTNEYLIDFIGKGILGLALKTLGSPPHWEVQGQGVTMVQFLYHASADCAQAFRILLPQKIINLIVEKPEICLRYFPSPLCLHFRKLGRLCLRMWPLFLEKILTPSKVYTKGGKDRKSLPPQFFESSRMAFKIREIFWSLTDLIESPVMEGTPVSPRPWPEEEDDVADFFDSDDDEKMGQYNTGLEVVLGDIRFESFRVYLNDADYVVSEDRLDQEIENNKKEKPSSGSLKGDDMDAYQIAALEDAKEGDPSKRSSNSGENGSFGDGSEGLTFEGYLTSLKNSYTGTLSARQSHHT